MSSSAADPGIASYDDHDDSRIYQRSPTTEATAIFPGATDVHSLASVGPRLTSASHSHCSSPEVTDPLAGPEGAPVDEANTAHRPAVRSISPPLVPSQTATSQVEPPLSTMRPDALAGNISRHALLTYAYHLYATGGQSPMTALLFNSPLNPSNDPVQVYKTQLLPLLTNLHALHPQDLSVLLLMACTYYAVGEFDTSLSVSQEMLKIDPNSAEAMSNIGTTMRAMGRHDQAYEWWWKALQIRPTYWDALENLFGALLSAAQHASDPIQGDMLHARALEVCNFVQRHVVGEDGRLQIQVPTEELHRLQKVYFTSATLRTMQPHSAQDGVTDYFRAIELVIRAPPHTVPAAHTMRDLILATFVASYLLQSATNGPVPAGILGALGLPANATMDTVLVSGLDLFRAVETAGDRLIQALLRAGDNTLPFLLLLPEHVSRLPMLLFRSTGGLLPALCPSLGQEAPRPPDPVMQQTNQMTSTVLLALAKRYQDIPSSEVSVPGFQNTLNINHSLAIMFYYLALSLNPSPSTYNNMGIILSYTSSVSTYIAGPGERILLSGSTLARVYYDAGLQLDPAHPHLLTNLGSLYKDQGHLDEAIRLYLKAIAAKPDFDIALANLGNAVKDAGRTWEAIAHYRRAVELNPDLPEAVCGLVSALSAVCDWRGRDALHAHELAVDDAGHIVPPGATARTGYMRRVVAICAAQLDAAYAQNVHCVRSAKTPDAWLASVRAAAGRALRPAEEARWRALFGLFYGPGRRGVNEGGFAIRFVNWVLPRLQRRWYVRAYGRVYASARVQAAVGQGDGELFLRPTLPGTMTPPAVPSILPFDTFIYPLSARMIRLISHRNALRISYTALSQPWLPRHVYPPPPPPVGDVLNVGYISNDVNNHPLAHLMLSVFALHDKRRVRVFLYTTSAWDGSAYRPKISRDVDVFVDAASWSSQQIVEDVVRNGIHVLVNLGGYTKGARNDVFAARPCPVQLQLIGYAGTLAAGWCDYLVCDPTACQPDLSAAELWRKRRDEAHVEQDGGIELTFDADLDPEAATDDWVFSEKFIYMPHTFMVADHRQSYRTDENLAPEERVATPAAILWRNEEKRRMEMRRNIFPDLPHDTVIFANFNQLYKIDPNIYAVWLRILARVPNSILWLLRFPAAGEEHLVRSAMLWAGADVAARVRFTDVAQKEMHIHRGRVADLFLDTAECNAHTIAADVLWPGTPILTYPKHRHKMCSRVAASMVGATGFGDQMVVHSLQEYEERAVALARGLTYTTMTEENSTAIVCGAGELIDLRRNIFLNRDTMPLFDTARWTRNIEKAYREAWRRWVEGTQFELSDEWEACTGPEKKSGNIWVVDDEPVHIVRYDSSQFS